MDRRITRQLASILLIMAIILIGIETTQSKSKAEKPPKEGYIELKQAEYESLKQEADHWKQKYEELNLAKAEKKDKPIVKAMNLNITEGMSSKEVSREMENAGIIKDAEEFNDYLATKKWQHSVQIGKYELTSDMGFQEIAETITGN